MKSSSLALGPAGIFTALTLADLGISKILLVERAKILVSAKVRISKTGFAGGEELGHLAMENLHFPPRLEGF